MVVHWKRQLKSSQARGLWLRIFVNGLGAVATGITTIVVLVTKFAEGAWVTVLLVAMMILLMRVVNRHYKRVAKEIALNEPISPAEVVEPIMIVPVDQWSRITEKALTFALSMSSDIRCVHVQVGDDLDEICSTWDVNVAAPLRAAGKPVPQMVVIRSPYRLHSAAGYGLCAEDRKRIRGAESLRAGAGAGGAALVGEPAAQPARRSAEGDSSGARQ